MDERPEASTASARARYGSRPEPPISPGLRKGLDHAQEPIRRTPETATALERLAYHIAGLRKCLTELDSHLCPVSRPVVEKEEMLKPETTEPQTQVAAQIEESVKAIARMDREVRDMISRLEI